MLRHARNIYRIACAKRVHRELCNSLQRMNEMISQRVTIFHGTKFGERRKRKLKQDVNNAKFDITQIKEYKSRQGNVNFLLCFIMLEIRMRVVMKISYDSCQRAQQSLWWYKEKALISADFALWIMTNEMLTKKK